MCVPIARYTGFIGHACNQVNPADNIKLGSKYFKENCVAVTATQNAICVATGKNYIAVPVFVQKSYLLK